MSKPSVYYVAFWTKNHPKAAGAIPEGWLSAVKVTIEFDALPPESGDLEEKYDVSLASHPAYPALRKYCVANK